MYRADDCRFWVTSYLESARATQQKRQGLRSGKALRGHVWSAHHGQVDASCLACQEILRKMKELEG
jgi:hypothetical protein